MKLFPSIRGKLGTWTFYGTKMSAQDLANQVKFASEVWQAKALDHWIQRTLKTNRAKEDIARYLVKHEDHFFNSIVIAALGGNPKFFPVEFTNDPQFAILADDRMNAAFGVLRFDGTQKYYALDGQHRLMAIKALVEGETEYTSPPGFVEEEFSVLVVVPTSEEDQREFLKKYRRLFSHLNRYAKPMDQATTIIMEEDDVFAICTRRLIQEHEFFSWFESEDTARVRCVGGANIGRGEAYFTNIITLYEMTKTLLHSRKRKNGEWRDLRVIVQNRPEDDVIEELYDELVKYWDAILQVLPDLRKETRLMRTDLAQDLERDGQVQTNHFLFRPIGQQLLAELVRRLVDDRVDSDDSSTVTTESIVEAIKTLGKIDWRLFQPPWKHLVFVYDSDADSWSMRSEDRRDAVKVGENIMIWFLGCVGFASEEDLDAAIKRKWKSLLLNVRDDEVEALWKSITEMAADIRSA